MGFQFIFNAISTLVILPVELVSIVTSYYSCSECASIRDRVRDLIYGNFLRTRPPRISGGSKLRFYSDNNKYYMEYSPMTGNPVRILTDLDSITAVLTHHTSISGVCTHQVFPSHTDPENHNTVSFGQSSHSWLSDDITPLMLILTYQVFRCPYQRRFLHRIGYDDDLTQLDSMNNVSSSGDGSPEDYVRPLPDGSWPLVDPAIQPFCIKSCNHSNINRYSYTTHRSCTPFQRNRLYTNLNDINLIHGIILSLIHTNSLP